MLLTSCVAPSTNEVNSNQLLGTWVGKAPWGESIRLNFNADGNVKINVDGHKGDGYYTTDFTKDPIELNINWKDKGIVKTIIRFESANRLTLVESIPGQPRPSAFNHMSVNLNRRQILTY